MHSNCFSNMYVDEAVFWAIFQTRSEVVLETEGYCFPNPMGSYNGYIFYILNQNETGQQSLRKSHFFVRGEAL